MTISESQPYWASSLRRFSSRSIASRINWAMPFSPTNWRISSLTSSGRRTCVALFPSGGLPITFSQNKRYRLLTL